MSVALACWRSAVRGSWRQAITLALLIGLLGAVALGALAGARRTATAYGRYLAASDASDRLRPLPGRQRRLRERAGQAAWDAGDAAGHADLLAARRRRPRRLRRPERSAGDPRPGRRLLPHQQRERQPRRRVLQPGPGDRAGGQAAAAGVDDHRGADARHRHDVRDRCRRHGQLPVPPAGRAGAARGHAVHPVLPGGGDRGGPARPGGPVRPGGGEHPAAGGDPAAAGDVLLRLDRPAPGPGRGRDP